MLFPQFWTSLGVSQHYADTYNEPLIERLKKELSDSDMRTYVYVVINDKPLAQVDGKRIDTSEGFMEALAPEGEEGEEGEGVSGDDRAGIEAVQTALRTTITGEISKQNYNSIIDEIAASSLSISQKRGMTVDLNQRMRESAGGGRTLNSIGYENARRDYWGELAKFITNAGPPPSEAVSEAKRVMAKKKLRSLINSVSRDILGEGALNEGDEFELVDPAVRFPAGGRGR